LLQGDSERKSREAKQRSILPRLSISHFVFEGLDFLLPVKLFLAERFAGYDLIVLYLDGEECPAFPATARSFITRVDQRELGLGAAFRAFDDNHTLLTKQDDCPIIPFYPSRRQNPPFLKK